MPVSTGFDRPIRALDRFLALVGSKGVDDIGYELKTSVVASIVHERAIDTTAFIQAIDYHRSVVVDGNHLRVDASNNPDVFYDGFVEFPTPNRDGSMRRGRFVYKQGIENGNLERIFDHLAEDAFVI